MKHVRAEVKELKQTERSRNPRERYGQSYSLRSMFFPKELETYNQATSSSEKKLVASNGRRAQSFSDTNTWTLVESPKDKTVTPLKWVYKVKTKADGSLEK